MENKAHALIAGVFVVVVTALLALLALWLTRDNVQRHLYEMSTSQTISGLQPQAAVRFRGVPVGKVESIGFDEKVKGNVLIVVSIDRAAPVTASTFAAVASQGVTGLGFIQLDDNGESTQRLTPNDDDPPRIPLQPSTLDKLLKQSQTIFVQAEQATTRLNQVLSDENQKAVNVAVTQLAEAAGSINRVAKGLEPTVAALPALTRDSGATLPKLSEVADETARTMRQLRRTVSAVDDNPQSLIFGNGPRQPGPGEPGFSANGDEK